jgi:hypothetical protein
MIKDRHPPHLLRDRVKPLMTKQSDGGVEGALGPGVKVSSPLRTCSILPKRYSFQHLSMLETWHTYEGFKEHNGAILRGRSA